MSEAMILSYHEDEIVLEQGDLSKCLYKVLSGSVGLFIRYGRPEEYLVGVLSAPRCFGEMTILAGQPSPYTVVAMKETTLMRVPEKNFEHFVQDNYQNAIMIMKTMARNLTMVNLNMSLLIDELTEISRSETVDEEAVKRLAAQYGGELEIAPTLEQLEEPESESALEMLNAGVCLPGHKGHPGSTHPEYLNSVYQKQYTCPHCNKTFMGWRIFTSKLVPTQEASWMTRYDGRSFYRNFEPYWYDVITCPSCFFSALSNYFLEPRMLFKARYAHQLKETAETLKLDFEAERSLDFVCAQHYLALICAQGFLLNQRRPSLVKLWKNLCWLYEDAGIQDLEQLAAAQAAQALIDTRSLHERNPHRHQKILMDIAAMLLKAGDNLQAREWAIRAREIESPNLYSDMAGRLIDEIREKTRG